MDYQGQQIKLTKYYLDYDDYKNDPDNIAPEETSRVEQLVMNAPIASSFPDKRAAIAAVFEIKFPGYGAGGFAGTVPIGIRSLVFQLRFRVPIRTATSSFAVRATAAYCSTTSSPPNSRMCIPLARNKGSLRQGSHGD